jgi:hypothetical protein
MSMGFWSDISWLHYSAVVEIFPKEKSSTI